MLIYKKDDPSIIHYLPERVTDFYERNGDISFMLILKNMLMSYYLIFFFLQIEKKYMELNQILIHLVLSYSEYFFKISDNL